MRLHAVGATETGKVRSHNEDVILIREDLQLFAVCDGAGGHQAGDVAAQLAAKSVANYLETTARQRDQLPDFDRFGIAVAARYLSRAIHEANREVHAAAQRVARERGMGSTIAAMLFSPSSGQLHVAHVGDSRCYRQRGGDFEPLTRDHSLLNDVLAERPDVDEEVLARLPRNVVTRALGMAAKTRVSIASFDVNPSDRYLLCTDGLGGYVPDQTIAACVGDARPAGAVVQLLINAADEAGGKDNVGIVLVECLETTVSAESRSHRLEAQRRAARTRAEQASSPELLLVGIEEMDVFKAVESLTGSGRSADGDPARLEAVDSEHDDE